MRDEMRELMLFYLSETHKFCHLSRKLGIGSYLLTVTVKYGFARSEMWSLCKKHVQLYEIIAKSIQQKLQAKQSIMYSTKAEV